ncbi:MAG: arsenite methyltransferase [Bacillota bacterium]
MHILEKKKSIKKFVSEAYGNIASEGNSCCGPPSCAPDQKAYLTGIGYSAEEIDKIPEEANLSLGCGNPTAMAQIKEGESVLDLGCGAGADCFLAAKKVGPEGRVIGVDMTPEMIEKARESSMNNVEFRLGEIENLPLADNSADIIISNCVINLSADKSRVFEEIFRVLKPGGRISISDIALTEELPSPIKESEQAYLGCIAGALLIHDYEQIVKDQGFKDVEIITHDSSACIASFTNDPVAKELLATSKNYEKDVTEKLQETVKSVNIKGKK